MKISKIFVFFICVILLSSILPIQNAFSASPTFPATETKLSDDTPISDKPAIVAAGNNVIIAFEDGSDIRIINSTDNGGNFPALPAKVIGDNAGAFKANTLVAVFDSNIFVVWHPNSTGINFTASIDNGLTFNTPIRIDINGTTSQDVQMAVSDSSNVYVVWHDKQTSRDNVLFKRSIDNGASFEPLQIIEDDAVGTSPSQPDPHVATSGEMVYVVWHNNTNILVARSSDNGANFDAPVNVGAVPNATFDRSIPQIAADGNNVYVTFRNQTAPSSQQVFARSTDKGVSFESPINLGSNGFVSGNVPAEMVISGDNVYVTWERVPVDDTLGDIIFIRSADKGATFESEINLSNDATTDSTDPKIAAFGTNVYVVWEDLRNDDFGDVLLAASSQSGASGSFPTNPQLISSATSSEVKNPVVAASGNKVYVAWRDDGNNSPPSNIFFKVGTQTGADIQFDEPKYRIGETPTITITDSDANENSESIEKISVNITSTSSPIGIPGNVTFTETGADTSVFTNSSIQFVTTSTNSLQLNITPGDTVTASFMDSGGQAAIFSRDITFGFASINRAGIPNIQVIDENSRGSVTITVTVTSQKDPTGITLTLTETGSNTAIFGGGTGPTKSNLVLFTDVGTATTNSEVTIKQNATASQGTITSTVKSTTDSTGISVDLTENGPAPGGESIYEGTFRTTTGISNDQSDQIQVVGGDIIEIFATGNGLTSNLLVTPASAADGALQVNTIDEGDDEVKVTLVETTSSPLPVRLQGGEGGGGGGLVRPGLVVNILASLGSAGGGGASAPVVTLNDLRFSSFIDIPDEIEQVVINFDPFIPLEPFDVTAEQFETFDFPLSIDNDGFALSGITNTIDTKTLNVGEPVKIKTVFYIPVEIEHVAFYTNMREGDTLGNSDTFLRFWKHGAEQFQIRDTNGFFEYINLTLEENGIKKIATFDMKFLKPMEKSDIVLRMWDAKLHSTTILIFDAIEVVEPENADLKNIEESESSSTDGSSEGIEIPEPGTTLPETSELRIEEPPTAIPDWIKTSAGWWHSGQIDKDSFVQGIQFLIKEKIINIPDLPEQASTTSEEHIPDWIKNTAGWWSEGVITEGDFVSGIKWLVENGIIRI